MKEDEYLHASYLDRNLVQMCNSEESLLQFVVWLLESGLVLFLQKPELFQL